VFSTTVSVHYFTKIQTDRQVRRAKLKTAKFMHLLI